MEKRIEKWKFDTADGVARMVGLIYGDDELPDGTEIRTAEIAGIRALSETIIFADGEELELGMPDPGYESRNPKSRQRFLESMCREFGKVYLEQKLQQGRYSNI